MYHYIVSKIDNKQRTMEARAANIKKAAEHDMSIYPIILKALELGMGNKMIVKNLNAMKKFTRLGNEWTETGIKRFRRKYRSQIMSDLKNK